MADVTKKIILLLLIIFAFSIEGHSSREKITFPVETRKYMSYSNVTFVNPPISATDNGAEGYIAFDYKYVYCCVATNNWKRAELSTWTESYWIWPDSHPIVWPSGDLMVFPE